MGEKPLKQNLSLQNDVKAVDTILKEAKVVKETNLNQIRLFLNGNPNSHLFAKFADLHPSLWGKYPSITNKEISELFQKTEKLSLDSKYDLFENTKHARKFTESDLEAIANWDKIPEDLDETTIYCSEMIDGRMINFNSEPEWKTYLGLKEKGLIQSFRAQSLEFYYDSYREKGRKCIPDFIFLTPEGYIAIVESKPTSLMGTYRVRCKYEALKKYCLAKGYLYTMVNENLVSIESIQNSPFENEVTQTFDHMVKDGEKFDNEKMKLLYDQFKQYSQIQIKEMIGQHILRLNLKNKSKYGFYINSKRKFKARKIALSETLNPPQL